MSDYRGRERKSVGLWNDDFNALNRLKQGYEKSAGPADWWAGHIVRTGFCKWARFYI